MHCSGCPAEILKNHTYDNRVDTLLQHLERAGSEKLAPARRWPESRVQLMQLDFSLRARPCILLRITVPQNRRPWHLEYR